MSTCKINGNDDDDRFICTVNLCSIDVSKAYDKVDHCALFMKLMKRDVPLKLLDTLAFWLLNSWSCVKWKSVFSHFLKLDYGVRQGSVMSPHLFAVYVDDITNCLSFGQKPLIIMYADDIILVAPSVYCVLRYVYCKSFWINASRSWIGSECRSTRRCRVVCE